jgi:hypothetical protein
MRVLQNILGQRRWPSQTGTSHATMRQPAFDALDVTSLSRVVGGFIGPDQDLSDFPVWAWPYINVARVGQIAYVGR